MPDEFSGGIGISPESFRVFIRWWSETLAENPDTIPEELTRLATDDDNAVRNRVSRNPNCPPLVKMWIESDRYGGMTLKEFLESTCLPT